MLASLHFKCHSDGISGAEHLASFAPGMNRYIKSTMMVIAGLCWIAFAVGVCLFLFGYLLGGAGLQVSGFFFPVSSVTVLVGLFHFVGFSAAAFLCFVIGVGLCAHGVVPAPEPEKKAVTEPIQHFAFLRRLSVGAPASEDSGAVLRCVRCRVTLATSVQICPDCGWTQPCNHHAYQSSVAAPR
jgi:hypothetical protein